MSLMKKAGFLAHTLDDNRCVEVTGVGGSIDGKLIGYAIYFSGGWDAWSVVGGRDKTPTPTMRKIDSNLPNSIQAFHRIADDWGARPPQEGPCPVAPT